MFVNSVALRLNVRHGANLLYRCYIYEFAEAGWWSYGRPARSRTAEGGCSHMRVEGRQRATVPTLEEEGDCLVSSMSPAGCKSAPSS